MINQHGSGKIYRYIRVFKWHFLIPLTFLLIILLFFPFRDKFGATDEGFNVIKASLLNEGYSLYGDVWSDQPPLFSYFLAMVFKAVGTKVNAGRFLVLLMSTVLVWAYTQFLRITLGEIHAIIGVLLLMILPEYVSLSVSVMVGLPAISFAMVSLLAMAIWHTQQGYLWLVVSAIALSLSIHTKLFTGLLVPIFIAGIMIGEYSRKQDRSLTLKRLRPVILWVSVFIGVSVILALTLVGPGNYWQLVEPHLTARQVEKYRIDPGTTLSSHIRAATPTLLLTVIGSLIALRRGNWLLVYPMVWMGSAYLFLSTHHPVWFHQQLLITIPAAILATGAVGRTICILPQLIRSKSLLNQKGRDMIFLFGLVILLAVQASQTLSPFRLYPSLKNPGLRVTSAEVKFLKTMNEFASETHWVVTDQPIYAFRANLLVIPPLAVISSKRLESGNLTETEILNAIREWKPEQILLARFYFPTLEAYLEEKYQLIQFREQMRLYIWKDLLAN